jgi:hypothetical protein
MSWSFPKSRGVAVKELSTTVAPFDKLFLDQQWDARTYV